ncbi:hypothetical protein Tco_0883616 [Tanacetum coccineum]
MWCLEVFLAHLKTRLTSDLFSLTIIKADLPPPNHVADLLKDEPVHTEPAPNILHHAPAQPEGYVGDDDMEEDEEEDPNEDLEEEPIEQLFGGNFHVGESSSTRALLAGNSWVHALGPMRCNLESVHRGVKRLDRQMFNRYNTKVRMAKKFKKDDLRMNRHECDITALDAVEEPSEPPIHLAFAPHSDDPYVMVRDAAIAARDDDGDDTTGPTDS